MSKKILLIDDDIDDRKLFCEAISKVDSRLTCLEVGNGTRAFAMLEKNEIDIPDIIFLDINMPGKNGWDCLAKLKGHQKLGNIPVIMYSTSSNEQDIARTKECGALGLFTKPHDYDELTHNLEIIVSHLQNNTLPSIADKNYRWFTAVTA